MQPTAQIGCGRAIAAIKEVGLRVRRLRACDALCDRTLTAPEAVARLANTLLRFEDQEVVLVFFVDGAKRVIAVHEVARGTIDECKLHPREVFRAAIVYGAKSIILAHNHPSGRAEPSLPDLDVTRCIHSAGRVLGIELLDHVIVTSYGEHYSFLAAGELEQSVEPLQLDAADIALDGKVR
jgi:DNA repair protein RadC